MSKVVRGIGKAVKKVAKAVKKHWKSIVMVGAAFFTAGIATAGWGAFTGVAKSHGLMTAVGSTIKAGVGATLGTLGIGSGAQGLVASAATSGAGAGATLGTGALASKLGAGAATNVAPKVAGEAVKGTVKEAAKGTFLRDLAVAAAPAAIMGVGAAQQAKAEQEAARGLAGWGVDHGGQAFQPDFAGGLMDQRATPAPGQRFTGPDRQQYEVGPDGRLRPVFQPSWTGQPPSVNNPIWQTPGHEQYMGGLT